MIKFWKSAAKGKTGCPVRPPETVENRPTKLLDIKGNNDVDGKTAIKYFTMYMENIGKQYLIKCWMDLENFRFQMSILNVNNKENCSQISHTRSLDGDSSIDMEKNCENFMIKKFGWRGSTSNLRKANNECSINSCGNLIQHLDNCDICEDKNVTNLTEKSIALFKKYVALEAPYHIDLSDDIRKTVISNICQPEGQIDENCFKPVQDSLFDQIDKNYFKGFQNSPLYIKSQIDILTSGCINLKDILYNDTILFYFTEFLEQESCSNLLEFLIAIMHFRDNLIMGNTPHLEQAQGDAIVLYDKYFSLQATNPIGFPTEIRLKVESDICSEPIATCFDTPYIIVYKTLSNYVKTFLGSELYYTYLSEMIKSVDQTWSPNCKSHSDCSSEFSISTQNTLLATTDTHFKKKRNHSVPDMTIDSNQLYNGDALWQRKKHDGLILGRINSLGRFESKFEPDPDKKEKSVLKKMVSKFVATNTSKVEEEMAWQIAHMIVKDVTDLTMSPPEHD
ncbi:A-kinase anchor protein 10, mitochondrial isoform X2 [Pararge aegeria]|uniref:A-kinase anchor protein 10, mitochondrial isoform X2 n=1 Tax=Pararge aegeria TaxID=116150 RepID=UPI0019D13709|nr:A-kinase anchor protein 10, mitochondrial isoform X2 [Pararge aegeria]